MSAYGRWVNVNEAKPRFSKLLKRVQLGEKIIIAKAGKPIAWLAPFNQVQGVRKPGSAKGIISVGADFDVPLLLRFKAPSSESAPKWSQLISVPDRFLK